MTYCEATAVQTVQEQSRTKSRRGSCLYRHLPHTRDAPQVGGNGTRFSTLGPGQLPIPTGMKSDHRLTPHVKPPSLTTEHLAVKGKGLPTFTSKKEAVLIIPG